MTKTAKTPLALISDKKHSSTLSHYPQKSEIEKEQRFYNLRRNENAATCIISASLYVATDGCFFYCWTEIEN